MCNLPALIILGHLPSKLMMLVIIFKKDHFMVLCPWYIYFPSILWEMRKPITDDGQNVRLFANNVRMIKPPYIKWCVKSSFFSRFTLLFRTGPSALLLIPSTFYYYCGLVFLPCLLKKGLISRHSKIVKCCVTTLWHQKMFKTEKYFYHSVTVSWHWKYYP